MDTPMEYWKKQRIHEKLLMDARRTPGLHPSLVDRMVSESFRQVLKRIEDGENVHIPTLEEIYGKEAASRMKQPRWANKKVNLGIKLIHARRLAMKYPD